MKKLALSMFVILSLVGCSDEDKIPRKEAAATVNEFNLSAFNLEQLKISLMNQIQNDNVKDIHLSVKKLNLNEKKALVDVDFELNHGGTESVTFTADYQNNRWQIACNLPICQFYGSPTSVIKYFLNAVESKNGMQLMSTLYIDNPYLKKRVQQHMNAVLEDKQREFFGQDGLKSVSFSIVSLNKNGSIATVPFEMIDKNGAATAHESVLVKVDGKWRIKCVLEDCLVYDQPKSIVQELVWAIVNGDPERFVNLLNVSSSEKTRLMQYYNVKLPDLKAAIEAKGGFKQLKIDRISFTQSHADKAHVEATMEYNDGSSEQQIYTTEFIKGRWFIQL